MGDAHWSRRKDWKGMTRGPGRVCFGCEKKVVIVTEYWDRFVRY